MFKIDKEEMNKLIDGREVYYEKGSLDDISILENKIKNQEIILKAIYNQNENNTRINTIKVVEEIKEKKIPFVSQISVEPVNVFNFDDETLKDALETAGLDEICNMKFESISDVEENLPMFTSLIFEDNEIFVKNTMDETTVKLVMDTNYMLYNADIIYDENVEIKQNDKENLYYYFSDSFVILNDEELEDQSIRILGYINLKKPAKF